MNYDLLLDDKYPLSAKYDPKWIYDHKMGCHVLWLTEGLARKMTLKKGMKILDLGCGNALSSIFLAKEFGVTVFANDLWVDPSDNYKRIVEAGVEDKVFPLKAEAHQLPYASGFFDAIIAVNAYQFFGTQDTYFADHLAHLLKPAGEFGLMLWGPDIEFADDAPDEFTAMWWPDFYYFHSLDWWKRHLKRTRLFDKIEGDDMDGDGVRITRLWAEIMDKSDELHTNGIMRWNRIVCKRNDKQADDLRTW